VGQNVRRIQVAGYAAAAAIAGLVGAPAAIASYRHAEKVAGKYDDTDMEAWLPLTTDGLLVAVLIVMGIRRVRREPVGIWLWLAFFLGMAATIGANLAAATIPAEGAPDAPAALDLGYFIVAVWAPVCFAVTLEVLVVLIRSIQALTSAPQPDPVPVPVPDRPKVDLTKRPKPKPKVKRTAPSRTRPAPAARTDEEIRDGVQLETDRLGAKPSARWVRDTYGVRADRANRILAEVRPPIRTTS
jgi:Protein of unknown function (DUF2637)